MSEAYGMEGFPIDPNAGPDFEPVSSPPPNWRCFGRNDDRKNMLLQEAIGREIRAKRAQLGITIMELANAAGISISMLSKVENGGISPSLDTLQALASALGVPLTALFRRFDDKGRAAFVKAGEGISACRRGVRAGRQYNLLGSLGSSTGDIVVEPYLVTLSRSSDEFPASRHDGMEFLYMLEGEIVYRHGGTFYPMTPGDSLFFDAGCPHGPYELVTLPIRFLSIISYRSGQGGV